MRLRRQKPVPQPTRIRTRFSIEVEVDLAQLPREPGQSLHSALEGKLVRLINASGVEVRSFLYEPVLDRRSAEYHRAVRLSMDMKPIEIGSGVIKT